MRNRVNKWRGIIALCLLLTVVFTGCTVPAGVDDSDGPKSIKIGVTLYDSYDIYITEFMEAFNQYARSLSEDLGITITIETEYALGSQSTQNSQVEEMIDDGCDILCVNLVDRTDAGRVIDLAKENDIPIIFFNRELVENDLKLSDNLYFVGASVEDAGQKQGELAVKYYRENPSMDKNGDGVLQYVMLQGEQGHQDSISRSKESVEVLKESGFRLEKISSEIANWSRDQAKTKMLNILETEDGERVELVFANNDAMALGVIDAYKAKEIDQSKWPVIFGVDGVAEGLEAVKNHEMQATVWNDIPNQAKSMLDFSLVLKGIIDGEGMENLPDDTKCYRTTYQYVMPSSEDERGYVILDNRKDLRNHNFNN